MAKVYLIKGSSRSWEDAREWFECAYVNESFANEELIRLNEDLKMRKENNKDNMARCNDVQSCGGDCDECEFEHDYILEEQHLYRLEIVQLKML